MGKASRDKGNRNERKIVNALRDAGIPARRVPLSGATEYAKGDVEIFPHSGWPVEWDDKDWLDKAKHIMRGEVKARRKFPAWLAEYLGDNDALFLVEDRQEPLVVMRLSKFTEMVR